ncbi:MAG: bifunctional pyr operon transcriptional regulator/uracil phosphoribosyltransferase PyrR [Deltaproteobacteria bacterium]|nr:bifunctional pyr operon transcriptional regulator/uracil phosphoribosyltransferase PyrR [Deltaproteobacteria bacterium]
MSGDQIQEIFPYRAAWQEPPSGPTVAEPEEAPLTGKEPRHLLSEADMDHAIEQIARRILSDVGEAGDVMLLGIRTRGVPLAEWIAAKVKKLSGHPIPVGSLDINLYRDDLSEVDRQPIVRQTELPIPIEGRGIILVDDVLFTGRTIRAALDALVDYGRPRFVRLAVMIDRGFRELPIQAEYVGKTVATTLKENVKVMLKSIDGANRVVIKEQK